MIIGINAGHTLTGTGTGAIGYAKETDKNRLVLKRLTEMLKEKGHTVINCTVDSSNNDLADIVKKEKAQKLDLFLSIHLNAFKKTNSEMGVETYCYSRNGKVYADRIQKELVAKTNWKNRGVKTAEFYVLKNTNSPSVLVELGFCDSKGDMDKWNTENICKALFKGITNTEYKNATPEKPSNTDKIYRVQVGAYKDRKNADEMLKKLKKAGFEGVIV